MLCKLFSLVKERKLCVILCGGKASERLVKMRYYGDSVNCSRNEMLAFRALAEAQRLECIKKGEPHQAVDKIISDIDDALSGGLIRFVEMKYVFEYHLLGSSNTLRHTCIGRCILDGINEIIQINGNKCVFDTFIEAPLK